MMRGSLQQRLFLVVLLSIVPIFVVHVAILIASDVHTARARTTNNTQDIAAAAIPLLQSTLVVGDLATSQETLDNIMRHGQFKSLRLYGPNTESILLEGKAVFSGKLDAVPDWFVDGLDFHFPAQRFPIRAGGTRYGVLVAEPSAQFLVADIWQRMWTAITLWLITLALALALLKITLQRGLQPLDDLARAAHYFGEGDLDSRAPVSDVPELAATAQAFNQMAKNLAEARSRLEERARQAVSELDRLISRIPAGVYKLRMLAKGGVRFEYVSPRWCELLEIEAGEVYRDAKAALTRLHPDEVEAYYRQYEVQYSGLTPFHWEGKLREGMRVRWLRVEATPSLLDNGDVLWEGIQYDISATKEREAELDHIAHYDALTGVPNRMLLADRLQQAIAQAQRSGTGLAVCFLDLDGFKPVNDALGHEAGDVLLVEIGRRLLATVRGGDTVARVGGDEFVLLLAGMSRMDEYEATLSRILDVVSAPMQIEGQRVSVTACLGIALYPKDEADPDLLLRHADQAMYQAKQAGKGKFIFFDTNLENAARRHRELLRQIEHGLADKEFELYYEPKVNMRLGTVIGFEALIRWRHPDQGLLLPDEFLPLIGDSDLIIALGEWVLDQALGQLGQWHRQGRVLSISVNLAAHQLLQGNLVQRLRQLLAIHADAPAERLEIEITETAALTDTTRIAAVIGECRQLGVSFAIDDFGTGYSSLTYLKNLPAQTLKIDQSFVRDMLADTNDLAIVEGVIGLTEIFRRQVIAEGVETARHCTLLLNMGCELAQGYGIAQPMPAGEVDAWLGRWRPDPAWQVGEELRWPRDDLTLVVAENMHRAWVERLTSYVEGVHTDSPEIDPGQCRFGLWYAGSGHHNYGQMPEFIAIADVHAQIHALGRELIVLTDQGKQTDAQSRLPELYALRDDLLALLQRLQVTAAPST